MLRVFVDSGSSIKEEEKDLYNVEIIPLKILLGNREYKDGVDLSMDEFYHQLLDKKIFPKTSLPSVVDFEDKVNDYTKAGDDVIIVTISSGISGTFSVFTQMFEEYKNVKFTYNEENASFIISMKASDWDRFWESAPQYLKDEFMDDEAPTRLNLC